MEQHYHENTQQILTALANDIPPVGAKVYNLTAILFIPSSLRIKNSGNTMASKGILVSDLGQTLEMQSIE
jgi:hypothetical protein